MVDACFFNSMNREQAVKEDYNSSVYPPPAYSVEDEWVKTYREQFGNEPYFF